MTAKPQPMAGQSDTSDDLIAELAKLMAQDATSEKPAAPANAAFPVRIPGGDTPPAPVPVPRFDFERSSAASGMAPAPKPAAPVPQPVAPAAATPSSVAPQPAPAAVAAAPVPTPAPAPEPFHFDFELTAPKPAAPSMPLRTEAPSSPLRPPADPSFMPVDHDSIADLIAAELLGDSEPPAAVPVAPTPAPVAQAPAPTPAPTVSTQRPTPQPASSNWAPVAVPASMGTEEKPSRPALRPLNLQPAQKLEQDRFKVAPVFGLSSGRAEPSVSPVVTEPSFSTPVPASATAPTNASTRAEPSFGWAQPPATPQPAPATDDDGLGRDPIDEIESLIGNARRVEFDRNEPVFQPERPVASPALRSLATPTIPAGRTLTGADEAIMAAAEATGVHIGWVDSPEAAEAAPAAPRRQRAPRALGMTRALAGPLVAVTLLLAAGFGLYWVLGLGREAGPAPLLTADATPTKETPVVEADASAPQQSVVFNEIDGVVPGAEEQLVSRDQADVNEVTQVPATTDQSEEGLANRKVRTVTVRPDGTIVSGEDNVAGSNILPVARPNVPELPGADTSTPELLASTQPASTAPAATGTAAVETPTPAAAETTSTPVTAGATVQAVDLSGNVLAGKTTVIPRTRPAGLVGPSAAATTPTSSVNAVVNTASTGNMLPPAPTNNALGLSASTAQPATQTTPAAAATTAAAAAPQATEVAALGNNAPAYVQLASQRTEDEARATANAMVTRYGPLFGGANLEVQRVDLGAKGIYYRVRVPAGSMQDASNICTNVKAAGGDCFTM